MSIFNQIKANIKLIIGSSIIIVVMILADLFSDSSKNIWQDFYDASFSNIVDSVRVGYRTHRILVNNKWYEIDAYDYTDFITFVSKGDSIYKKSKKWDIIVMKKSGNQWLQKYFKGEEYNY